MTSKGFYIFNILLLISIATLLYAIRLPINTETKISWGYPKDSLFNFTELTNEYGYSSQEHTVVTEDGYILTMFRINKGRNCNGKTKLPPVILMHGLLQSSDSWLDAGPDAGLAYLIADECFDLWVGNCRGNYYSRRHVSLNPDTDHQYWQFSVDEIGYYDVPAMMDYVLDHTGADNLNYIGFSQGAGTFFIMCSERPGYCEKANVMIALAPAARQTNTGSILYRFIMESVYTIEGILKKTSVGEILPKGSFSQEFLAFFCQLNSMTGSICTTVQSLLDAYHPGSVSNETTRVLYGHFPAGTSVHNMARYGQSMMRNDFAKFDYGKVHNLELYGSEEPPKYNLSAVTVPVVTLYGRNDGLVDVKDVKWLLKKLPNVVEEMAVSDALWTHLDVTYSQYTRTLIFPKIYEHLQSNSYN
ncbi:lipase 3-like [Ostrinia furnacalis]|uniref:lipase 3-like n=1 Tax=Ostrinia furnacalis TaxID=93504 RepID=UPI00103F55BD|nr:lipase 3-like [Ostrinia furnacalis]